MHSDLTKANRKFLELHSKKKIVSKPKLMIKGLTPSKSSRSLLKNNSSFASRSENSQNANKSLSNRSKTGKSKAKLKKSPLRPSNIQYEVEKLLRSLYRHSVTCKAFKQELENSQKVSLLSEYFEWRGLNKY